VDHENNCHRVNHFKKKNGKGGRKEKSKKAHELTAKRRKIPANANVTLIPKSPGLEKDP